MSVAARRAAVAAAPCGALTAIDLTWIEGEIEQWSRFGRLCGERIIDRRRRVVMLRPGGLFALVSWASNAFGTVDSRIAIACAVGIGEAFATLPFVRPGGRRLLRLHRWSRVARALRAIDAGEAVGVDPCAAAPDHWRHVHNRMAAGCAPRRFSIARHRAWLQRRRILE
ncbi:DUF2840 domain-containing protein [Sphingomonas sp. AR_OL41]|uniref:DUF2840 domain-containing protein n=1 Tax=Sphingomonas sp. AR_OL41 TaxID=3042729 RepID=UPI002480B84A|nr:DUF2840 domain-containing protein [Sphingomonas sp. AR_OL41]MDH7973290.1 DUF2840 domain-containing protein [Sphingomonas sp. AR_OL41]